MSAALMASIGARLGNTGSMVGKAASWAGGYASTHPSTVMGAIGGLGGYIGSGGSGWGAMAGAGLGAVGGRKGWDTKSGSTLDKWSNRLAGKNPSSALSRVKGIQEYGMGRSVMGIRQDLMRPFSQGSRMNARHQQNIRGIQTGLRSAGTLGAGIGAGIGAGFIGNIGSSYGSERRSHHGAVFSGMGNGTVTNY